jgi:hypothetical protein
MKMKYIKILRKQILAVHILMTIIANAQKINPIKIAKIPYSVKDTLIFQNILSLLKMQINLKKFTNK